MIEIKNIVKQYNGVPVINNLNLTVNDGEFVVLIGPSGCGKTTTLKMIKPINRSRFRGYSDQWKKHT